MSTLHDVPAAVESALREAMRADYFHPVSIDAALGWLRHRGVLKGCPEILPADWPVFQAVVDKARAAAEPCEACDEGPGAEAWGGWTDRVRVALGPDPADAQWWAENSPANRTGFTVVRRRPLPDFRPVRTTGRRAPVSGYSDYDQAVAACV